MAVFYFACLMFAVTEMLVTLIAKSIGIFGMFLLGALVSLYLFVKETDRENKNDDDYTGPGLAV